VLTRPSKKFVAKQIKQDIKNAEFYADFKTVEKVAKNAHTKSHKETNLMNVSKSGKSTFFHHFFVNNFLCVNLFASFQQF
jgi:hypothetical protein